MFTPKQSRNGADVGGDGGVNTAVSGPDVTAQAGSLMGQSESAAGVRGNEGHQFMTLPQGSGLDGHEIGGYGAMFEWDAGLAINDVEGPGSG